LELKSSAATVTLTNSTVNDNGGIFDGGGVIDDGGIIENNGGIYFGGFRSEFSVRNSTISGNYGGIYFGSNNGRLELINATFTGNGSGVYSSESAPTPLLNNTIVAGNLSDNQIIGGYTGNNNLIVKDAAGIFDGGLHDNGGPTRTIALLPFDPAVNAGNNAAAVGLAYDQRGPGFPRIFDETVDIGAYELQSAANAPPTAADDTASTDEDTVLSGDVLVDNGNGADSDPDGDLLTVTEVNGQAGDVDTPLTLASGALLTLRVDGTFTYDPNGKFESLGVGDTDTDSFSYTIGDGNGGLDTATVEIIIDGVNDPPVATDELLDPTEDDFIIDLHSLLLSNDTDPDENDNRDIISVDTSGTVGAVFFEDSTDTLTYMATGFDHLDLGEKGADSFTYTIRDGNGATDTATVNIMVSGQPDPPVAGDDTVNVNEDETTLNLHASLLANDVDPDNPNSKNIIAVNSVNTTGTVSFDDATDTLTYSANDFNSLALGETTTDSFTYTFSDNLGPLDTAEATVVVTITGINDAPVASDDTASTDEDTP
jgi:VCBS repeat-containing protein